MAKQSSEKNMKFPTLVLIAILLPASFAAAETLRCGSKIVDVGMSMDQVRKFCGQPSSSSIEEQDVRAGNRVVGKTQLHIWHYKRSSGQKTAILEFDQDKLMSIHYASK